MSLIAKGTLSLRKQDVLQQKKAGTAYRRLVFAHKAAAGETGITVGSLVQPSEMAALGFTNPSNADILAANILFYKKNLTVISSARGVLMQDLSYTVPTSARIEFQGFTALEGEIFTCLLETGVRDGLTLVDASPIVATGELAIGSTDFNVGTPFEANKYNSQQIGAVLVFRNGQIQFRNPSNGTSGGNYQEVNNGDGLSTVIRFNNAPVGQTDNIVVWGHLLAERPDGSMMASIESLAGQLDSMIPIVAALAGVPETTFQAAPNNQDLKAFGDKVEALLDAQVPIATDWKSVSTGNITGSGGGTLAIGTGGGALYAVEMKQIGDEALIKYTIRIGTSGTSDVAGTYLFPLPTGISINTSGYSNYNFIGNGDISVVATANPVSRLTLKFYSATSFIADVGDTALLSGGGALYSNANIVSMIVRVKVAGWSSTQTLRQQLGL